MIHHHSVVIFVTINAMVTATATIAMTVVIIAPLGHVETEEQINQVTRQTSKPGTITSIFSSLLFFIIIGD
jgi:hypothetical protein